MNLLETHIKLKSIKEALEGLKRTNYLTAPKEEILMYSKYRKAFFEVLTELRSKYWDYFSHFSLFEKNLTHLDDREYRLSQVLGNKKDEQYSKYVLDHLIIDIDYCINVLHGLNQTKLLIGTFPVFRGIQTRLLWEISNAKKDIILASAWLTDTDLINKLKEMVESGLKVQIIIDSVDENFKKTSHFDDFVKSGGEIFVYSDDEEKCKMHHKFCIIDFQTTITGSYNWTFQAHWNLENVIFIKDNEFIARVFLSEFEYIKGKCISYEEFINKEPTKE